MAHRTFRVQVTETVTKTYTVEAGSEDEAREQALQIFDSTALRTIENVRRSLRLKMGAEARHDLFRREPGSLVLMLQVAPGVTADEVMDHLNCDALCAMEEDHQLITSWAWGNDDHVNWASGEGPGTPIL